MPLSPFWLTSPATARPKPVITPSCCSATWLLRRNSAEAWKAGPREMFSTTRRLIAPATISTIAARVIKSAHCRCRRMNPIKPGSLSEELRAPLRRGQPQVLVGGGGDDPAARGALQQAELEQIRLV